MRKGRTLNSEDWGVGVGFKTRLMVFLARSFIRALYATIRIRESDAHHLDSLEQEGKSALLPFFHGRMFLLYGYLIGRKYSVMVSRSRDGEIITMVLERLGHRIIRGSSSRGGARGLIALKSDMDNGFHGAFAVDGPRGPIHEIKPGVIYLAKKTGAPVVPILTSANPGIVMVKSWDRYLLPMPFARGVVHFGEPIYFDANMDDESMEIDSKRLRDIMLSLQEEADEMVGRKKVEREKGKGKR